MADYEKVGLLTIRENRILLCRKKQGTSLLILPGGCREPGESAMNCLLREVREELGEVSIGEAEWLGVYFDRAAGPSGKTVEIELYRAVLTGEPVPSAEIAELVWFGADCDFRKLAPSIVNKILPDLISRGILQWG